MSNDITLQRPKTGRTLREDSSVINTAELQALNTKVLTTTPLIIDAVYTGATIDSLSVFPIPQYAFAYSYSDVASATTGFIIEQSDHANMSSPTTIVSATASAGALTQLAATAITQRYFRVKYTNAHANPQTSFILVLGYMPACPSLSVVSGSVTVSGAVTNAVLTAVEDQTTHYLAVRTLAPTTPVSGAITEADTNIHRFVGSTTPCGSRVKVTADAANNAGGVLIGGAAPAFPLYPGQSTDVAINDLYNLYYQFGYAGDKIYYIQSA